MDEEKSDKLSLVYYNSRGLCQIIRYVLLVIDIPFNEIFIEMNEKIPKSLSDLGVDLSKVPCILSEGKAICDFFPIMKFLCRKYHRQELLGRNMKDEAKINEIMVRYVKQKCKAFTFFFTVIGECMKNQKNIGALKIEMMEKHLTENQYLRQTPKLYIESGTYLLGYLTILDFIFYESCFYLSGFFKDLCKKKLPIYLTYKNFFQKTEFYLKNKLKIESYPLLMQQFPLKLQQGFKMLWEGDQKYFPK